MTPDIEYDRRRDAVVQAALDAHKYNTLIVTEDLDRACRELNDYLIGIIRAAKKDDDSTRPRPHPISDQTKKLRDALKPFALVWGINEVLQPDLEAGMSQYVAGLWPTMGDCKAAHDLLVKLKHRFK